MNLSVLSVLVSLLLRSVLIKSNILKCVDIRSRLGMNSKLVLRFDKLDDLKIDCNETVKIAGLNVIPNYQIFLNKSINLGNITIPFIFYGYNFYIYLNNFNGINLNIKQFLTFKPGLVIPTSLVIDYSVLRFYLYNRIISGSRCCDTYTNSLTLFYYLSEVYFFYNTKYYEDTCAYYFQNNQIKKIVFNEMSNTFIRSNFLTFYDCHSNHTNFSSTIKYAEITVFYLKIDTSIFEKQLFRNLNSLTIGGILNEIDGSIFETLNKLRYVKFALLKMSKFLSSNPDWMEYINSDLYFEYRNYTELFKILEKFKNRMFYIFLNLADFDDQNTIYNFPNEDLCFFKKFPHNRLVYPAIANSENYQENCSCTLIWLIRDVNMFNTYFNYSQIVEYYFMLDMGDSRFDSHSSFPYLCKDKTWLEYQLLCNFSVRFNNCMVENVIILHNDTFYDVRNRLYLFEYVSSIFIIPILSVFSILFNVLSIVLIRNKAMKKEFTANLFIFIQINCVFSILLSMVMILSLINNCIIEVGIYCSIIRIYLPVQYFDKIILKYVGSAIKFCCNISYISVSYSRLVNIINSKNCIILHLNKIKYSYYLIIVVISSLIVSSIKIIQFHVNYDLSGNTETKLFMSFPTDYYLSEHSAYEFDENKIFNTFYIAYISFNGIFLVIMMTVFDIALLIKVKYKNSSSAAKSSALLLNLSYKKKKKTKIVKKE